MSADNGVYVRQLKDGRYAVKHIASLYPEDMTDTELDEEFSTGAVFRNTSWEAMETAEEIAEGCDILEYGICDVPRKDEPCLQGAQGTYTVTVERVHKETWTYSDVTPEQAERMALRSAEGSAKPGYEVRVVSVKTAGR